MLYRARLSISSKFFINLIDKTWATIQHSRISLGSDTNLLKQQRVLHSRPQLTDYFRITELLFLPDYRFALRNIGDFFALRFRFKSSLRAFFTPFCWHCITYLVKDISLKKRLLWTNYIIALTLICHIVQVISIICVKHVKFCGRTLPTIIVRLNIGRSWTGANGSHAPIYI